jgi:hypothetical protein
MKELVYILALLWVINLVALVVVIDFAINKEQQNCIPARNDAQMLNGYNKEI